MAKKKSTQRRVQSSRRSSPLRPTVTVERFTRLYRLVKLLGEEAQSREVLTAQLGLDVRGFYRDLEMLRRVAIPVKFFNGLYSLEEPLKTALARLPYPDPRLSLGDMQQLARGRSKLHQALKAQLDMMLQQLP